MLANDPPLTVNDESRWDGFDSAEVTHHLFVSEYDGVVPPHLVCELFHCFNSALIEGNADNRKPLFRILLLQLNEARDFGSARRTPCRPKIQNNHLALEIRGTNGLAVWVAQFPILRWRGLSEDIQRDLPSLLVRQQHDTGEQHAGHGKACTYHS